MVSEWSRDEYRITTDIGSFDFDVVHRYLSEVAYWSPGISREKVERSATHSLAFGLFHRGVQIGYARAITDTVSFAYLADVFVLPGRQRDGLGTWLVECVLAHPDLGLSSYSQPCCSGTWSRTAALRTLTTHARDISSA